MIDENIFNTLWRFSLMATDRTPQLKRVKRAEEGRENWKEKASLRREENEKLKLELARKDERLAKKDSEIKEMKKVIESTDKSILKYEQEIEELKKKL